jgi:hypothetical protein
MSIENQQKMLLSVGEVEADGALLDGALLVSSVDGAGALVSSERECVDGDAVHRDRTSGFCGGF